MIEVLHIKDWLKKRKNIILITNLEDYWKKFPIGNEQVDVFIAAHKAQVMARTNRFVFNAPAITNSDSSF